MTDTKPVTFFAKDALNNPRRRALVKGTIAWGVLGGVTSQLPMKAVWAAAPAEAVEIPAAVSAFQKVSVFLTSKAVSPSMASRAYDAIKKRMPDLDNVVASLDTLVKTKQLGHMDDYLALQDVDKTLDTNAKDIVRALYLGIVGDDEKAELFAYEEAFMYDSTRAILVVPTYGRGPDTWGPKPEDVVAKVEG